MVWKSRGEEAKEEVVEAGHEQSRSNTWRRGGTRLRRGRRPGEERGPCLARENQLGEVSPVGQSGRADRDEVEHDNQEEGDVLSND